MTWWHHQHTPNHVAQKKLKSLLSDYFPPFLVFDLVNSSSLLSPFTTLESSLKTTWGAERWSIVVTWFFFDRISGEIPRTKGMERGVVAPQNDVLLASVSWVCFSGYYIVDIFYKNRTIEHGFLKKLDWRNYQKSILLDESNKTVVFQLELWIKFEDFCIANFQNQFFDWGLGPWRWWLAFAGQSSNRCHF